MMTRDLAVILSEQNGISVAEAERFIKTAFQLVREGLEHDDIVKIKGLGVFKSVRVDAKESINVRSGEKTLIDGYVKVSFVPERSLRDIINKPFAQFKAVDLKDDVDFDDLEHIDESVISELLAKEDTELRSLDDLESLLEKHDAEVAEEQVAEKEDERPVTENTAFGQWAETATYGVSIPVIKAEPEEPTPTAESMKTEVPDDADQEEEEIDDADEADEVEDVVYDEDDDEVSLEDDDENIPEEIVESIPEETPADVPEDVPADVPEDVPVDVPEDAPADVPEETPVDVPEDVLADLPEDVLADVPEDVPAEVLEEAPAEVPEDGAEDVSVESEEERNWTKPLLQALAVLVLMAASAYGGYWYGKQETEKPAPVSQEKAVIQKTKKSQVVAKPKAEAKVEAKGDVKAETKVEAKVEPKAPAKAPQAAASTQQAFDSEKYDQMNPMVRLGAYRIVGVEETVTLKEGQTLKGLARTRLGADEMVCYILALNELTDAKGVKAGQKIKMPKLELRKKRKASPTVK